MTEVKNDVSFSSSLTFFKSLQNNAGGRVDESLKIFAENDEKKSGLGKDIKSENGGNSFTGNAKTPTEIQENRDMFKAKVVEFERENSGFLRRINEKENFLETSNLNLIQEDEDKIKKEKTDEVETRRFEISATTSDGDGYENQTDRQEYNGVSQPGGPGYCGFIIGKSTETDPKNMEYSNDHGTKQTELNKTENQEVYLNKCEKNLENEEDETDKCKKKSLLEDDGNLEDNSKRARKDLEDLNETEMNKEKEDLKTIGKNTEKEDFDKHEKDETDKYKKESLPEDDGNLEDNSKRARKDLEDLNETEMNKEKGDLKTIGKNTEKENNKDGEKLKKKGKKKKIDKTKKNKEDLSEEENDKDIDSFKTDENGKEKERQKKTGKSKEKEDLKKSGQNKKTEKAKQDKKDNLNKDERKKEVKEKEELKEKIKDNRKLKKADKKKEKDSKKSRSSEEDFMKAVKNHEKEDATKTAETNGMVVLGINRNNYEGTPDIITQSESINKNDTTEYKNSDEENRNDTEAKPAAENNFIDCEKVETKLESEKEKDHRGIGLDPKDDDLNRVENENGILDRKKNTEETNGQLKPDAGNIRGNQDQASDGGTILTDKEGRCVSNIYEFGLFECDVCETSFITKAELNRHITVHTGERYKCDVCNKSYYNEERK